MDLLQLLYGPAGTVLGVVGHKVIAKHQERRPFRRMVGMRPEDGAVILMPYRDPPLAQQNEEPAASDVSIHANVHVTFHDMLAVNYAERVLALAGFAENTVHVEPVASEDVTMPSLTKQLVLICSPRANPYSRDAIKYLRHKHPDLGIGFEPVSGALDRWKFTFKGANYFSDTYDQIPELKRQGRDPDRGPLHDYAMVARFPNPWAPLKSKVLLLAGIRGIGTWGAARFLRDKATYLSKTFQGRDFLGVVKVRFADYKIDAPELVNEAPLEER